MLTTSILGAASAHADSAPQCTATDHCYSVGVIGSQAEPLWMNAVGADLGVGCLHVDDRDNEYANWEMWILTNLNDPKLDTWVEAGMTAGTLDASPGGEKGFLWYWADSRPGSPYRESYIKPARTNEFENVTFKWVPGSGDWEVRQDGDRVAVSERNGAYGGRADNGLEVTTPGARIAGASTNFQYQDTGNVWHAAPTYIENDRPDLFFGYTNGKNVVAGTHKPCVNEVSTMTGSNEATPPTPAGLLAAARKLASQNGEPNPGNIEYVATGRQALSTLDGSRTTSDDPAYFVQMTGDFVGHAAKVPRGSKAPRGNVLTLTIDATTGRTLGWSIALAPHDLSRFGTVSTLR
ncbi:hypothetical protein [Amycolatopsis sp. NPDC052450]|uniref:hypothetical protein n=1 Tax=Amycolatopsis sp. NPDC052450 TaxID=3363937 RepID=UPI0037C7AD11